MSTRNPLTPKRVAAVLVVAVAIVIAGSQTLFAAPMSRTSSPSHAITLRGGASKTVVRTGQVNLATLPTFKGHASASTAAKPLVNRQRKSPAQQAAYEQWVKSHASQLPQASGHAVPGAQSPNFIGTGTIPTLVNQADGINYTQSGCSCTPPDQAIAAAPGYVFEGVNNLLEVYTPTYAQKYGPWQAQTFFGPLYHSGDFFADPQITFDAERAVYVIAWLETNSTETADYIDLAISKTSSPSPLSNFNLYQIPANVTGANDFCDYDTLGYDYWALWVSCVTFNGSTGAFVGNRVFGFNINGMLAGSLGTYRYYSNVPTSLSSGTQPAYRLSPTIEDGVPQAEWVIASDDGFGATSQNLTLCAITNTHAITSGSAPTMSCDFNTLPQAYSDPINADEPGNPGAVYPGDGTKQIMYRNGQLYFAQPTTVSCSGTTVDGILWAAVTPQLSTLAAHNPQQVNGIVSGMTNSGIYCFSNAYAYMPSIVASSEGDVALVFNTSSSTVYPSIAYTGRMAADAPGTMGQTGASATVVAGTTANTTGRWGDYSACALTTNLVSRGIAFCAGEYGGADVWNTRMYQLRME